eukprot:784026-Rhodomonas_salina.1
MRGSERESSDGEKRGRKREKVEGEARGKERVAAAICLRRKGGCAPDGSTRIQDVRSRCKDVLRNPCCTVHRLESKAFARRDHTVVCVSRTSRLRRRGRSNSTRVKFREETK